MSIINKITVFLSILAALLFFSVYNHEQHEKKRKEQEFIKRREIAQLDWESAQSEDTTDSYRRFLIDHRGSFIKIKEATERLWELTKWEDTIDSYKKYLEVTGYSKGEAKKKLLEKLVEAGEKGFRGEYCCGRDNGKWCEWDNGNAEKMGIFCTCKELYSKLPIITSGIVCPDSTTAILLHK